MPNVTANGIQIEYDTFGDKKNPAILLIIGLGCQMIYWDDPLCIKLSDSGLYVIRFDNRDTGLSSKFDEAGVPDIMQAFQDRMEGKEIKAPYTHKDMANDAVGLLDALNIEKAHICGMSMGAAIAQTFVIGNRSRALSLISIYGSTGDPGLPQPKPEAINVFLAPPPENREQFIEQGIESTKILSGTGFPFDEAWHGNLAARAFDRSFYLSGTPRQILAGMASSYRKPALKKMTLPTLVVHGIDDPAVPVEGGKDTADTIPNAELMLIEGMGHDTPKLGGAWDQITDRIIEFTGKMNS
ncbi:MAG: alpha/beta hydrolase [Proteobacteria bacterium]|nr:alpha/beta hydrolase [Pseudomonadota bacterium]